jgi:hypothetical protein
LVPVVPAPCAAGGGVTGAVPIAVSPNTNACTVSVAWIRGNALSLSLKLIESTTKSRPFADRWPERTRTRLRSR